MHKTTTNNNSVFNPVTIPQTFSTSLYFTDANGIRRISDGVIGVYDNSYSATVDGYDADEINNFDENIAIAREGHHLAIESRPVITLRDTMPLFMNNMKVRSYEFEFTAGNFSNPSLNAELVDQFLQTRTPISVTGSTTVISFSITSDPASSANNRFMVVFSPFTALPVTISHIHAYQQSQGINVEWTTQNEISIDHYEVERSLDGITFSRLGNVASHGNGSTLVDYHLFDANPFAGINYYRIRSVSLTGNSYYSTVVKVLINQAPASFSIYPNPVKDNTFVLRLPAMERGMYKISLTNYLGQHVYEKEFSYDGASATQRVVVDKPVARGVYDVQVSGAGVMMVQQIVFE